MLIKKIGSDEFPHALSLILTVFCSMMPLITQSMGYKPLNQSFVTKHF